jgi:glycosyltransferase involved in cell wall biosynthesis
MRVFYVAPHLPPDHVGGVEIYTQYLMRAMRDRGVDVEGVAVETLGSGDDDACRAVGDDRDGAPTHRLALTLSPSRPFALLTSHEPAGAWIEARLRATRPDVVHVQSGYLLGVPALAAAARVGVPVVLTLHDYWFACPRITLRHPDGEVCSGPERPAKCAWCLGADQRRYRLLDRLSGGTLSHGRDRSSLWQHALGGQTDAIAARQHELRAWLDSAAVVLAPVRFVADRVAQIGVARERIHLSRCGIPPLARHPRRHDGPLRLSFIGQLAPHKGVHLAVAAVRALAGRPVSLDIHGPLTPNRDYVDALRTAAGDDPRIVFHGPYRREALADLLAAADAVVVPSVWHEVAALTIQEAQMAGVPVVASALGGSPELIRDDVDGLLFDPSQPASLVAQLARLLDEPGLRARLNAAAPLPRTIDDEVDSLLALYAGVGCSA